jgi:hypothetical protein
LYYVGIYMQYPYRCFCPAAWYCSCSLFPTRRR